MSTLVLSILSEQNQGLPLNKGSNQGGFVTDPPSSGLSVDTSVGHQSNSEFAKQFSLMRQQISQQNTIKGKRLPPIQTNLLDIVKAQADKLNIDLTNSPDIKIINQTNLSNQELNQLLSNGLTESSAGSGSKELKRLLASLGLDISYKDEVKTNEFHLKLPKVKDLEHKLTEAPAEWLIEGINLDPNDKTIAETQLKINKLATNIDLTVSTVAPDFSSKSQTVELVLTDIAKVDGKFSEGVKNELTDLKNLVKQNRGSWELPAGKLSLQESNSSLKESLPPLSLLANKESGEKAGLLSPELNNKSFFDKLQQVKMGNKISEELSKSVIQLQKGVKIDNALSQLGSVSQYTEQQPVSEPRSLYGASQSPIITSDTASTQNTNQITQPNLQSGLSLRNDFSPNLAARIQWIYSQAMSSAEIMMDPAELGPMNVKMKTINGETSILFQVNNLQTKEVIEDNLSKLRELLSDQGMSLGDAHVEQQSENEKSDENSSESAFANLDDTDDRDSRPHTSVQEGILDTYI